MYFGESVSCPGARFSKVLVTFRARKAVFVCLVCIQDQGLDDLKNDQMKLSIDEAKLTGLWARNCAIIQQILIWNLPSGPKSYRAFRETRPWYLKKLHRITGFVHSLEFLKNSWNLPSNFPDPEKVWRMEVKSGKMVKSLEFFFHVSTSAL